jgi:hypothetical protein
MFIENPQQSVSWATSIQTTTTKSSQSILISSSHVHLSYTDSSYCCIRLKICVNVSSSPVMSLFLSIPSSLIRITQIICGKDTYILQHHQFKRYDLHIYVTEIVLTLCGSKTVHNYTQTIHRTQRVPQSYKSCARKCVYVRVCIHVRERTSKYANIQMCYIYSRVYIR